MDVDREDSESSSVTICKECAKETDAAAREAVQWKLDTLKKTREMVDQAVQRQEAELLLKSQQLVERDEHIMKLRSEIMTLQNDAAASKIESSAKERILNEKEKILKETSAQLSAATKSHGHLQETFTALHEQLSIQTEAHSRLQLHCEETLKKKEMLEQELHDIMQQFNQAKMQLQRLTTELNDSRSTNDNQQRENAQLQSRLEQLEAESSQRSTEIQILHNQQQQVSARAEELTTDKAEYSKALEGSMQRIQELSESIKTHQEQLLESQRQNAKLLEQNSKIQSTNSHITEQVQNQISENQKLTSWIHELECKKISSDERLQELQKALTAQKTEISNLREERDSMNASMCHERQEEAKERAALLATLGSWLSDMQTLLDTTVKKQLDLVLDFMKQCESIQEDMSNSSFFEAAFVKLQTLKRLSETEASDSDYATPKDLPGVEERCRILMKHLVALPEILQCTIDGTDNLHKTRHQKLMQELFKGFQSVMTSPFSTTVSTTTSPLSADFLRLAQTLRCKEAEEVNELRTALNAEKAKNQVLLELRNKQTAMINEQNRFSKDEREPL